MINFDPGIVAIIIAAGVLGWPLDKAIKWLKDKLRLKGLLVYVAELLVCGTATGIYLVGTGWDWLSLALYTGLVFCSVHGWYVKAK